MEQLNGIHTLANKNMAGNITLVHINSHIRTRQAKRMEQQNSIDDKGFFFALHENNAHAFLMHTLSPQYAPSVSMCGVY